MVLRQARLIALLLLATIAALALASVVWLGPQAPFVTLGHGKTPRLLDTRQAALVAVGYALVLSLVFDRAARVRRWRRNIVRAGGAFATAWVGALALILLTQLMGWAQALGHPVAREAAFAAAVALLLLLKANFLPKSRPAWFNGTTLPIFAADPAVWRRVHRASALRLLAIGAAILIAVAAMPSSPLLRPLVTGLLLFELTLATAHGVLLGGLARVRGRTA